MHMHYPVIVHPCDIQVANAFSNPRVLSLLMLLVVGW